jgi:hypothetical protein
VSGQNGRACSELYAGACPHISPDEKAGIACPVCAARRRRSHVGGGEADGANRAGAVTCDGRATWAAGIPSMGALSHPTPRRGFIAGALASVALPLIRTTRVAAGAVGMTDEQARMIQAICNGADGECISCAEELRDALIEAFPEHADAFREVHAERYGNWWRDEQ